MLSILKGRIWFTGNWLSSRVSSTVAIKSERVKNKFIGDGAEFFKNVLHKDNLPFIGLFAAGIFFMARGYNLEKRVAAVEKEMEIGFNRIDEKLDKQFSVIMAFTAPRRITSLKEESLKEESSKEEAAKEEAAKEGENINKNGAKGGK